MSHRATVRRASGRNHGVLEAGCPTCGYLVADGAESREELTVVANAHRADHGERPL